MGDLPKVRLTPYEPLLTYCGVDYFGPFYVNRGRGRVTEKRWGVIFVCLNSRAVHHELAKSLETDRIFNRRAHVKENRSDNGTNFVSADKEIKRSLINVDHGREERDLMSRGCKCTPPPPGTSHMSGVWERVVRTVKRTQGKGLFNNKKQNDKKLLYYKNLQLAMEWP